jgi:hypothetical protein
VEQVRAQAPEESTVKAVEPLMARVLEMLVDLSAG